MKVPGRLLTLALVPALTLAAAPADAFDLHDIRYLRETGYRWCRECDLSEAQLQGADLRGARLQGAYLHRTQLLFGLLMTDHGDR